MRKGGKRGSVKAHGAVLDHSSLRVSRSTLNRLSGGRVIVNHRPTQETQRRLELLLASVSVLRFDPEARVPDGVPDTYEKVYDRAVEQFLELFDAEPQFKIPSILGPTAKRRGIWVRGDLILRVEQIARGYLCPVSRIVELAIETYVDHHTRGIDRKLIATLAATAQKILDSSESTGKSFRERERKSRKVLRTGQV